MIKNKVLNTIKVISLGSLLSLFFFSTILTQITPPLTENERESSICRNLEYESDAINDFFVYRAFLVRYDKVNRIPSFTIHKLSPNEIITQNIAKRRSTFYIDEYNLGIASATNADYKGSGYDRGHMVPAGDYNANRLLKDETFYLTNICPQSAILNRGIWKNLEDAIRKKIVKNECSAVIITGSIVDSINKETIGLNKVAVPGYFYKIIFFPDRLEMGAFLFSNYMDYYSGDLENYQVRVDDIEFITGQNFFDKLESAIQDDLESKKTSFMHDD